jgi:hypothetical protein
MALDKAIKHKKEKRKEYFGGKAWDRSCRPGGSCPWCAGSRLLYKRAHKEWAKKLID